MSKFSFPQFSSSSSSQFGTIASVNSTGFSVTSPSTVSTPALSGFPNPLFGSSTGAFFGLNSSSASQSPFVSGFGNQSGSQSSFNFSSNAAQTNPSFGSSTGAFFGLNSSSASQSPFVSGFGNQSGSQSSFNFSSNAAQTNPLFGSSTGAFFGLNSSSASQSPFVSGFGNQSGSQSSFNFSSNAAQTTPFNSGPFSAQTQSSSTGFSFSQSNSNSPFVSANSNAFSAQTQSNQGTAFSPFSSQSNAGFINSNPFSTQTQSGGVTAFSPSSSQSNASFSFPSVHPNPFSAQTPSSGVTPVSPFSSQSNITSPFPSTLSNPFSTQSNGGTTFSPFSSQSNITSPFPSTISNPFSTQTQNTVATPFSPFYSHSNTSSPFPPVHTNPFSSQTQNSFPSLNSNPFSARGQSNGVTGSRLAPYAPTKVKDGSNEYNLLSISSMQVYESKSHEELRFEDYQPCKKDNQSALTQAEIGIWANNSTAFLPVNPNDPEGNLLSISSLPAYTSKSHEELRLENYHLCKKDGQIATTQPSIGIQPPNFCPSPFPPLKPTFTTNLTPATVNTHSMPSNQTPAQNPLFPSSFSFFSTTPTVTPSVSNGFFPPTSATTESIFAPKCPTIIPQPAPSPLNPNLSQFKPPGSDVCLNCKCFKSQLSQPTSFGPITPTPNQLNPSSIQQIVQGPGIAADSTPNFQSPAGLQPFPDTVQRPPSHPAPVISVQFGISSMAVSDKAAPTRRKSLLIVRHSSLNRIKMLPPRYNPDRNGPRVPFFMTGEEKETEGLANTSSVINQRENPRSWIHPQGPQSYNPNTLPEMEHTSINVYEDGNIVVELSERDSTCSLYPDNGIQQNAGDVTQAHQAEVKQTETCEAGNNNRDTELSAHLTGVKQTETCEAGNNNRDTELSARLAEVKQTETCEAGNNNRDTELSGILPKLENNDYYSEPTIQELAAKEKQESGFCSRVKDFVLGRRGYGAIKFIGETDVRGLDLNALIQFNHHEVVVYMDESKKPEVGKGLNKPAEVSLLNIKCIDKKDGKEYTDGPMLEKYKNLLIRKATEQGAEFVSYDPVEGEWKFKVEHF